ncbi:GNAT family N-acetyltransferase [Halalkalicoccus tibetensis]|uniref:GNAT family N-acetyltransferase n=1 Tax=Halalkalicoccus tibetensis TaxID=175632 RepID=A0ABD5V6B5_9EURY
MVAIRPARPEDAEAIRETALASWHAAYDDLLGGETVEALVEEWYALDGLRESIEHPEHVVRVADDVVGFAHIGPNPNEEHVAELLRLYVRPKRWGEGIGSRLLAAVEGELADYDRLTLSVLAENEVGIGFYEKRGFEREGEREVEVGGESYREYRYGKGI